MYIKNLFLDKNNRNAKKKKLPFYAEHPPTVQPLSQLHGFISAALSLC